MRGSVAAGMLVAIAFAAAGAPNGVPARPRTLGSWRDHDPVSPAPGKQRWTPSDVVSFLALYPDAYMDTGYRDAEPAGNNYWRDTGKLVDQAQALARARGVPVESRICVTERPDVMTKMIHEGGCDPTWGGGGCDWEGDMDGSRGETENVVKAAGQATGGTTTVLDDAKASWDPNNWGHRLLVLRPNGSGEERRRIVANDATTITVSQPFSTPPAPGNRYEIRGSFDPAWVKRVPRAASAATVQQLWTGLRNVCPPGHACLPPAQPLDPFDPADQRSWVAWMDRSALLALANSSSVPALYGSVGGGQAPVDSINFRDPFFQPAAVVVDLDNPSYRAWRIRYLLYKLADYGIAPAEGACLLEAYKPGWYGYYDEAANGPSNDPCSVSGSHLWTGPAHVCKDGRAPGGPFDSGLYGPGEFEAGLNDYFRELFAALAAAGYTDVRIITEERPSYGDTPWSLLADDVKASPQMIGEWDRAIEPSLSQIQAAGATPPPAPPPPDLNANPPPAARSESTSAEDPASSDRKEGTGGGRFLPGDTGAREDATILAPSLKGIH